MLNELNHRITELHSKNEKLTKKICDDILNIILMSNFSFTKNYDLETYSVKKMPLIPKFLVVKYTVTNFLFCFIY